MLFMLVQMAVGQGKLLKLDCSVMVPAPIDAAPIRSPQAIHTAMLPHISGQHLVEIGTRNGDGMACFSQVTASALAVELSRPYCDYLERRAAEQQPGRSWQVTCRDYRSVSKFEGQVFTWWQQCVMSDSNTHVHGRVALCWLERKPPGQRGEGSSHRVAIVAAK